jgi:hypothetical protein
MLYFVDWCIINFVENLIELSIGGDDPINIIPLKGKLVKCQRGPATVNGSNVALKPLYKNNVWEGATYYDHEPGDLPIQEHQICLRG